jgi:hypothetical protein
VRRHAGIADLDGATVKCNRLTCTSETGSRRRAKLELGQSSPRISDPMDASHERCVPPVPPRLKGASARRVGAWNARARKRAEAYAALCATATEARLKALSLAARARYERDHAFGLRAEEELRDANAAGAARAALAIAAACTDAECEHIQREEDRARDQRLQRHIERISIPEDRYTLASEDPSVWRALSIRRVTHGPRRVRRAPRRARRARRVAAVARGSPGDDTPPAEPPGEPGDASGPRGRL